MSGDRITRIAELEIDPAQLTRYRELLAEEIAGTEQNEPGVRMLYALSDQASPASIRIVEVYESAEAYQAHLRSPHFLKYKAATEGMVLSLRLVDMDRIAGFARRV